MRIPLATYRFQFNRGFTFAHARALLPYLRELGISDVYASPLFQATPESTHGYDTCAFNCINPNIGTSDELAAFADDLRAHGMGLLLDIVPNHMGAHTSNSWWNDVLTHGEKSEYARFFDIDWNSSIPGLKGKVLLPVLGDHYSAVLERGELRIENAPGRDALPRVRGALHLAYFENHFPLSPESLDQFNLKDSSKAALDKINGRPGEPASFNRLNQLIQAQHYRLAYWRAGPHEINYRRFFDVTALVSVRVEDDKVFRASHELITDLVRTGKVTGLRVDHPDGLRDPKTYFDRLRAATNTYVVAEKILSEEEKLPEEWAVDGTTGYDYLIYQNALFVRSENEAEFTRIYSVFQSKENTEDYATLAYRSKQDVLKRMFVAEVNSLTERLKAVSAKSRYGVDFTEAELRTAIIDFIAGFPVYRTYVTEGRGISPAERHYIQTGLEQAKRRTTSQDHRSLQFLAQILALDWPPDFDDELKKQTREFVIRFQQLSGPATAKGLEDTAFYRFTRFASLNEVGGNAGEFGISIDKFHSYNQHKAGKCPHSLLATSTHDTKRAEDVRARLNVLSEIPAEWERRVMRWREFNAPLKAREMADMSVDEYLIYQVLVGTWTPGTDIPTYITRIQDYMQKAMREAKAATSWTEPNERYEISVKEFVKKIIENRQFMEDFTPFAGHVAFFGMFNSLAQVLIKICSPGVPDFYQGTELWDLSLVDPDNRRPVDYDLRSKLLNEIATRQPAELIQQWQSGAPKLFTLRTALKIRNEFRHIFDGAYKPIRVTGAKKDHVIAFARTAQKGTIIAVAPRFVRTLTNGKTKAPTGEEWADTTLEFDKRRFRNFFTRGEISSLQIADILKHFPVALLLALD